MHKSLYCSFFLASALGCLPAAGQAMTKFLSTPDGAMTAYFDGPQCAERIQILFEAASPDAFDEETTPASRLMANATRVMSRQCKDVKRIVSKGVVDGRVLYNGIAEASTDWALTDIGIRSSGVALSGDTDPGQRDEYSSSAAYVSFSDISADIGDKIYCANPSDDTCIGQVVFENTAAGATLTARYLLEDDGTEALLTYPGVETAGALCSATADVGIDVVGGNLSDEGRLEYGQMLRERVESGGEEVCSLFQKTDTDLFMANFDFEGRMMGEPSLLVAAEGEIKLRLEN